MAFRLHDSAVDDDIEFLYERSPEPIICQFCSKNLDHISEKDRNIHYSVHLDDEPQVSISSKKHSYSFASNTLSKARRLFQPGQDSKNTFWHPSQVTSPPENHTPGLVNLLKVHLKKSRNTQRAWLCAENAVHIGVEWWDRGWGCGYRNFLMACSALMTQTQQPMYFALLDTDPPPGVLNLQRWIEDAWAKGFDKQGAQELCHKLFNTRKWIGTAEIWVAFTSRGIPSHLLDVHVRDKRQDFQLLLSWIEEYFSEDAAKQSLNAHDVLRGASAVTVTQKMPIILQHEGHSRTIVGYEKCENGSINLLQFDPSKRIPSHIRKVALEKRSSSEAQSSKPNGLKRPAGDSPRLATKRVRSGTQHDAIVIDSDDDEQVEVFINKSPAKGSKSSDVDLKTADVLKLFRFPASSLKHNKYQVLYFPLSAPLTESEQRDRRVVLSYKVERNTS